MCALCLAAPQTPVEKAFTQIQMEFREDLASAKLTLALSQQNDTKFANVVVKDGVAEIGINPKLATSSMNSDHWLPVLCHELGHVLAGAPHIYLSPDEGGDYSAEGQSDYFAAAKCLKRIWNNEEENRAYVKKLDTNFIKMLKAQKCESDQCIRIAHVNQENLQQFYPEEKFTLASRSTVKVSFTNTTPYSLSAQCRMDTYLAGAICNVDPNIPFSQWNQREGACLQESTDPLTKLGARPACWFMPDDIGGRI